MFLVDEVSILSSFDVMNTFYFVLVHTFQEDAKEYNGINICSISTTFLLPSS